MLAQSKNRATDFDRLHTWKVLFIAAFVLLFLPSGATFLSIGMPKPAGFQQKPPNVRSKKLPGPVDPKSVLAAPGVSTTQQRQPPQRPPPPPPTPPHFQVIATPPSVRTGETVVFNIQPLGLVLKYPRQLEIDFGDNTPRLELDGAGTNIPHWYQTEGSHPVGIYFGSERSPGSRPLLVSDPLAIRVGPWLLSPPRASVEIGDEVTLAIDHPSTERGLEYRFHFGDDSPAGDWVSGSKATHQYHSAKTYKPFAEIRRVIDRPMNPLARTTDVSITVTPLPQSALRLDVVPTPPVEVEKAVTFTATLVSKFDKDDSHIRYRFDFGDKSPIIWQDSSEVTHHYSSTGTHYAQVEVAWVDEKFKVNATIATSKPPHKIDVTEIPNPPAGSGGSSGSSFVGSSVRGTPSTSTPKGGPDWNLIIIPALAVIALAILFAGYQTLKGRFSVKPDYQAHRDIGIAQTTGGSLAIEFDIRLKPDLSDAQYQLDVPEAGLINYERRQHD